MKVSAAAAILYATSALAAPTATTVEARHEDVEARAGTAGLVGAGLGVLGGILGVGSTALGLNNAVEAATPRALSPLEARAAKDTPAGIIGGGLGVLGGLLGVGSTALGLNNAVDAATPRSISDKEARDLVARGWTNPLAIAGGVLGTIAGGLGIGGGAVTAANATPRALSPVEKRSQDEIKMGLGILNDVKDHTHSHFTGTARSAVLLSDVVSSNFPAGNAKRAVQEMPSGLRILADASGYEKSIFQKTAKRASPETTSATHTSQMSAEEVKEGVRQLGEAGLKLAGIQ